MVTATWESPKRRAFGATGIAILENDVRRYVAKNHAAKWRHWGIGDSPKATSANLARMTEVFKESLRMLLICAHGDEIRLGVSLADEEPWLGRGAKIDNCDFLVLASCAMGKLLHSSGQDVEGFLADLFTQGAKSVLAAKWRIADMETSQFLYEVITSYLREFEINPSEKFLRARVLNRVLRDFFETSNDHQIPKFTKHLAMAFDIYGLG